MEMVDNETFILGKAIVATWKIRRRHFEHGNNDDSSFLDACANSSVSACMGSCIIPVNALRSKHPPCLGDVVTLTGWDNQVQSMTCSEYVQQTWPLYGMSILYAVHDAIESRGVTIRRKYFS